MLKKSIKENCTKGYIWFDYESFQENGIHVANLIISDRRCMKCIENHKCTDSLCGIKMFETNDDFCIWLFDDYNKNFTALAHNAQGFDGIFLMKYIIKTMTSNDPMPNIIMKGTKLLTLSYRDVKLLDSFCFIPMALEKFSKTFGLNELKKGFFPHLFNKPENQHYIGSIPHRSYFAPEFFNDSKRIEFENWYVVQSNYLYNFKSELIEYCKSDVQLLKEGTLAYRRIILDITGTIDPFEKCITMASVCHLIFRELLMKPKSIGIIPLLGFNPEQKSSNVSLLWLRFISFSEKIYIQHAKNGGEFKIGKYLVDGYHKDSKTIFEFNGCHWHGCLSCYSPNAFNNQKQKSYESIYKSHCDRIKNIEKLLPDHKIRQMWECTFRNFRKQNPLFDEFEKNYEFTEPLNPRESLFGGRTNSIKLYYKCEPGERIMYVDYKSLYPSVQKYGKFPVGHPTLITENFSHINNYFGLIKCSVVPPKKLHIPVLPVRIDGKLFFPLCSKCALERSPNCNHSDKERTLVGTWVTLEVQEAIKNGYYINKIYEVWHYNDSSQYDPVTKTGGLFASYVDMFLKYKEEASGFPDNVNTEAEKDKYIKEFFDQEGIQLDKEKIKYNPGIRSVMKLLLNSFWGRLGMNTNQSKVKFINSIDTWYKLIGEEQCVVNDVDLSIDDVLIAYYSENSDSFDGGNTIHQVSVVLASFVTCHGRLKLFSEMNKLQEQVIYHDTDSIIYSVKPGQYEPSLGANLGELTNEISLSEGGYIKEILAPGPKNYMLVKANNEIKTVIKGFSANKSMKEFFKY